MESDNNKTNYTTLSSLENNDLNNNNLYDNLYNMDNSLFTTFSNSKVRKKFVTTLYLILTIIQLISCISSILFYNSKSFHDFVKSESGITFSCISGILYLVILILLITSPEFSKLHPSNLILLIIIALLQCYIYCAINVFKNSETFNSIIYANLLITGFLTLITYQSKLDFTDFSMTVFSIIISFIFIIIRDNHFNAPTGHTVLGCISITLLIIYTIYDIQYIVSGNRSYEYEEDDYIFGVLTLHFDIINMILYSCKYIIGKIC
jgi:FtsH-binding integral membrane protein